MFALAQRNSRFKLSVFLGLLFLTAVTTKAQCTFTNGDFETGNLTGWTQFDRISSGGLYSASWSNYTGTAGPLSGNSISAPPGPGTRAAIADQTGPAVQVLYQDVTIPAGTFATLSFFLAYNNTWSTFVTPETLDFTNSQQFRVDLMKTTAGNESVAASDVIFPVYRTRAGDPLVMSPLKFTYDVSAFAGQTVRVRFGESVGLNYFLTAIDQVCLQSVAVNNSRNTPVNGSAYKLNFGSVTVNFPAASVTTGGTTTIQQLDAAAQTNPPVGETFVGPAYDISTTATVVGLPTICVTAPAITDATTFSHLRLLHKQAGIWVDLPTSSVNFSTKQVCAQTTSLSPFIVGQRPALPSASEADISGIVTAPDGTPLGGVSLQLSGSQNLRTITRADGSYSFKVEPGGLYTIKPMRSDYVFAPSERSVSTVGSVGEVSFTAVADEVTRNNPLDTDLFFVRQQYLDFLDREPDSGGLDYWTGRIDICGSDASCLHQQRVGVSAAFFIESEFQNTGSFVYRLYDTALGRRLTYSEFTSDRAQVVAGSNLTAARAALVNSLVARSEFQQRYASATSADSFVGLLLNTIQSHEGIDLSSERQSLIAAYNSAADMNQSRSLVLQSVVDLAAVKQATYNSSFVAMEYFGYLQRNPDEGGYQFWLNVLNHDPSNFRGMVCSFLTSTEYQGRFSKAITHSNSECGQ